MAGYLLPLCLQISIHAPRAGRDRLKTGSIIGEKLFQSTRPVRGATALVTAEAADRIISIHAPRAGRDLYMVVSAR